MISIFKKLKDEKPSFDELSDLDYEVMFDRKIPYINFNNEEN